LEIVRHQPDPSIHADVNYTLVRAYNDIRRA